MNILLTGSTGYVGRNFLKLFNIQNNKLFILGRNKPILKNIKHKFYHCDLSSIRSLTRIQKELPPIDIVVHIAANIRYFEKFSTLYNDNVMSTKNLIKILDLKILKKFIYISSIEASGGGNCGQINVSPWDTNRKPSSSYGKSKLLSEKVINTSEIKQFYILRLGNVYDTMSQNNLIKFFFDSYINRSRFFLLSYLFGNRHIQPIHNDDVARIIEHCIYDKDVSSKRLLVAENSISIEGIYKFIATKTNIKILVSSYKKNYIADFLYLFFRTAYHKLKNKNDMLSYIYANTFTKVNRSFDNASLKNSQIFLQHTITNCMDDYNDIN